MKVALCLSGQLRTFMECYPSLKKFILDPLKPDVFICTDSYIGVTREVAKKESFNSGHIDKKELIKFYAPKFMIIEDFKEEFTNEIKGIKVPEILKKEEPKDYKGALPMSHQIYECNELKKRWEREKGFIYDIVIRLRPDILFLEKIPEEILNNPETVWYNNSENGAPCAPWQISDKFILSNSKNMDYVASLFKRLPEYWKNPLGDGRKGQHRVGERLMAYHLKKGDFKIKEFFSKCSILRPENFSEIKRKRKPAEFLKSKIRLLLNKNILGKKLISYYYDNIMGKY